MSNFGRRADRQNMEFIRLNSKAITFERREKQNGTYVVAESFNKVAGTLVDARIDSYEYKGEKKYKLVLDYEDMDGNKAVVDINFNSACVNIMNSLAVPNMEGLPAASSKMVKTLDKPTPFGREVSISVYPREYEGEKYCATAVRIDDELTDWAFNANVMAFLRDDIKKEGKKTIEFFNRHIKPLAEQYNLEQPKGSDAESYFPSAEDEPKSEPAGVEDEMLF